MFRALVAVVLMQHKYAGNVCNDGPIAGSSLGLVHQLVH